VVLLMLSATLLLSVLVLCRALVLSKLGRVLTAIRDAEDRVRFCGYDPVSFKLFVWTLSACICGIAGAPSTYRRWGIINPSEMSPGQLGGDRHRRGPGWTGARSSVPILGAGCSTGRRAC
jgi:urea transport system permease protein